MCLFLNKIKFNNFIAQRLKLHHQNVLISATRKTLIFNTNYNKIQNQVLFLCNLMKSDAYEQWIYHKIREIKFSTDKQILFIHKREKKPECTQCCQESFCGCYTLPHFLCYALPHIFYFWKNWCNFEAK
jgi:hypothetical protein